MFVFVAVAEEMRPTEVPSLAADGERCRRLRQDALDNDPERP